MLRVLNFINFSVVLLCIINICYVGCLLDRFKSLAIPRRADLRRIVDKHVNRRGDDYLNDAVVEELQKLNPTSNPGAASSFERYAKGLWNVVYAPHITSIESILGVEFEVFYILDGKGQAISNVKFQHKPLRIDGWLNVKGSYGSIDNDRCTVQWDRVWCDFEKQSPSKFDEVEKHWLPDLVQAIGTALFVDGVSRFPVYYVDDTVCIFEFSMLGTKIVAKKLNSDSLDQRVSC